MQSPQAYHSVTNSHFEDTEDTPRDSVLVPTGDISEILKLGSELQEQATRHQIHNVFDDGGYKELLLLKLFNLTKLDRTGDDAADRHGRRYEIKTVARVAANGKRKNSLSVTTEHTLTLENIRRYRSVHLWIIAIFDQAHPEEIYEISPQALEPYFERWEERLLALERRRGDGDVTPSINNPKINIKFVREHGIRIWPEGPVQLPLSVQESLEEAHKLH
jgi:hypothetical protein